VFPSIITQRALLTHGNHSSLIHPYECNMNSSGVVTE
jgi:hypothetical protein